MKLQHCFIVTIQTNKINALPSYTCDFFALRQSYLKCSCSQICEDP